MSQGDKHRYTDKQKRKAAHIEEGYEQRGLSPRAAAARAWATVNKTDGGGKLSGSGRAPDGTSHAARSRAAKKGWATRRKNAA